MKKYQEIIRHFETQIEQGIWQPGDKVPSVRALAGDFHCSVGTVQHAYALLEDQSILHSRDRSGFYVAFSDYDGRELREEPVFNPDPGPVNILDTAIEVMERDDSTISYGLGSAVPFLNPRMEKQMQQALVSAARQKPNQYEGPLGYLPLRKEIARRSIRSGKAIATEELMITTGCQESLFLALQVATKPGDLVLVESPCYYGVLQTLEIMNRQVLEIPLCPVRGMDFNYLESVLNSYPVAAMVINSSFSNPTGFTYSDEEKKILCDIFSRRDIPIIEDDVFAELSYSESRPRSIQSFDRQGNVLLCSSFSKTLSQDLRIGWLVPGRFFREAKAFKYVSTLGTPPIQQYALAEFLSTQNYERHLRVVRQEYRKRQNHFLQYIEDYFPPEVKVSRPEGGYLGWIRLDPSTDTRRLYHAALEKGIAITPGFLFSTTNRFNYYIRLNWGSIPLDQMKTALHLLSTLLKK